MIKLLTTFGVIFTITLIINESKEDDDQTEIDWCDKEKWCAYNVGNHIKCNNTGQFSPDCPVDIQLIPINKKMKKDILNEHNKYRNLIASGKLPNFEPAQRMGKMCYCHDLERMAELNVKTCKLEHDYCRSTEKYLYSGQNLFQWRSNGKPKNIQKILLNGITDWFDQYKLANMSIIDKYITVEANIGHFTTMVTEGNRCVGCSAIKMSKDGFYEILFACNYASTNVFNLPVYKSGKSGSKCETGRSKRYPSLCSVKEPYSVFDNYEEENEP